MSLSGFLMVFVGLAIRGSVSGLGPGNAASVKSGFMNLLFLVYTPLCKVLRLYDLPLLVGHWMISAGVQIFLSGSS